MLGWMVLIRNLMQIIPKARLQSTVLLYLQFDAFCGLRFDVRSGDNCLQPQQLRTSTSHPQDTYHGVPRTPASSRIIRG